MTSEFVIDAQNITVEYEVSAYRTTSFKELIMNKVRGLHKVELFRALNNVSVQIKKGEAVAFLGHNGSGKSTLLKVIAGIIEPLGSTVNVKGRVAPMIELGAGFDGELSGLENIRLSCTLMGLDAFEIEARLDSIVEFAELTEFINMPLKNYSSGMQARLGFACATAVDPDILLVDEVLSVGDSNFSKKCLARIDALRKLGTTVVLVSHDMTLVRTFCERAYVLDHGNILFSGDIHRAIDTYESLMEKRYLESLSAAERKEAERVRRLRSDAEARERGQQTLTPTLRRVVPTIKQNNEVCEKVSVKQPFQLCFQLSFENPEHFEGDVSFGIGVNALSDLRLSGINNLLKKVLVPIDQIRKCRELLVTFHFPKGLPYFATTAVKVILGVHDKHITRTIYIGEVLRVQFQNEDFPVNYDGNLIEISDVEISITTQDVP